MEEEASQQEPKYPLSIPTDQSIVIRDEAQGIQQFGMPMQSEWTGPDLLRIQHLADNVQKDLNLLKEYEDVLRYEDEPIRRERYKMQIERLRSSVTQHQQEYKELRGKTGARQPQQLKDIGTQLREMDTKLDDLLSGQIAIQDNLSNMRMAVLNRFEATEQAIITAVVERLDQGQLAKTQEVLNAIKDGRISENELQETLTSVQQVLTEFRQTGNTLSDSTLASIAECLREVMEEAKLDVSHKLKMSIPIIPFLLSYEGEIGVRREQRLKKVWQRLLAIVRGGDE